MTSALIVESEMYKLAGAVTFVLFAAAFVWAGDPLLAILLAACAVTWIAATSELGSLRSRSSDFWDDYLRR